MSDERSAREELVKGIWRENPVFVAVLGLCPALAVTNSLINGLVMGAATLFVLLGSSLLVSTFRKVIPKQVRISVYIIIIAVYVTIVDFVLAAVLPTAHKQLGAFISLIVVNCVILGRQEAFASKHSPRLAAADALGMAAGFTLTLAMIGGIREVLGNGTLAGVMLFGENFEPWVVMKLPPGGFFTLGVLLVVFAWVRERRLRKSAAAAGASGTAMPGRAS